MLTDQVKISGKYMWKLDSDARQFITQLERLLSRTPIPHSHWTSFIPLMIPPEFETQQDWIHNNIMVPQVSWNTAKQRFLTQFQRGEYRDGRLALYNNCVQGRSETVQEYSLRFQTLCTQLNYADANEQTINHYFTGLHINIRTELEKYCAMIRNAGIGNGPAPSWDF